MSDPNTPYPSYPGSQPPEQPTDHPGPAPYPQAPASYPPAQPPGPGQPVASRRPGGVTAAAVITIVLSAISTVAGIVFAAASNPLAEALRDDPELLEDFSASDRQDILEVVDSALVGFGVITVVIGIIGIVLGILVLKPRPWARILLTIGASLTAMVGLVASFSLVGLPWLVGAITVIVLLFAGKAGDWFAGRPPAR